MGVCASSQITRQGGGMKWPSTAKLIHLDGKLEEFTQPIGAGDVLSRNPDCFICSVETMYVDSLAPRLPNDEQLELGQIYFLMPVSKSQTPLSLRDFCALAMKASAALSASGLGILTNTSSEQLSIPDRCRTPTTGFAAVGVGINGQVMGGNRRMNGVVFFD